jgi:hypothetical protein
MSDKLEIKGPSIGFCGLLTVLFIGLKLTGFIDWSWFWVLSPLFLGWIFILMIFVVLLILYAMFS